MSPKLRRALTWIAVLAIVAVGLNELGHFAWRETWHALLATNLAILAAALVINLSSLVAKGWAWQLLLGAVHDTPWVPAQKANLIGAAVTNLAGSVVGEAARARTLVKLTGVPWRTSIMSVVSVRVVELIALAIFLVVAPFVFPLPSGLRVFELVAVALLAGVALLALFRGLGRLVQWLPQRLRPAMATFASLVSLRRLPLPILLALANWITQWLTFWLTLRAVHVPASLSAAFAALIATNLSGLLRLPAGNVGIFQASMAVGLLPFGIAPEDAVAAGIVLQGMQVLPVLVLGAAVAGLDGLAQLRRATADEPEAYEAESSALR